MDKTYMNGDAISRQIIMNNGWRGAAPQTGEEWWEEARDTIYHKRKNIGVVQIYELKFSLCHMNVWMLFRKAKNQLITKLIAKAPGNSQDETFLTLLSLINTSLKNGYCDTTLSNHVLELIDMSRE